MQIEKYFPEEKKPDKEIPLPSITGKEEKEDVFNIFERTLRIKLAGRIPRVEEYGDEFIGFELDATPLFLADFSNCADALKTSLQEITKPEFEPQLAYVSHDSPFLMLIPIKELLSMIDQLPPEIKERLVEAGIGLVGYLIGKVIEKIKKGRQIAGDKRKKKITMFILKVTKKGIEAKYKKEEIF